MPNFSEHLNFAFKNKISLHGKNASMYQDSIRKKECIQAGIVMVFKYLKSNWLARNEWKLHHKSNLEELLFGTDYQYINLLKMSDYNWKS